MLCTTNTTNFRNGCNSDDPASDAVWILTSTFIIFTMQAGFGLLESGSVSTKNEVNIMVKNAVDVIYGGVTYFVVGYGLSFGQHPTYSNSFCGWGSFLLLDVNEDFGWYYAKFFFQASFATTATTIVSGAMAERTKLESYILFSILNTFVYCFPAHWVWAEGGWLERMGVIDVAGAGPVHLVGGTTGLVATIMLKPRHKRYDRQEPPPMGAPTNALLGMFMLWWGWLGFNCGSTFGISGQKWKLAARSAVTTICASIGGGGTGLAFSYVIRNKRFEITFLINGLLGALVSITASCALVDPWEGLVIGMVGSMVSILTSLLLDILHIDDPVGCVGTHASGAIWSLLAAGLFVRKDSYSMELKTAQHDGLFKGGGWDQLGIQAIATASIVAWTVVTSTILLVVVQATVGLRLSLKAEVLGSDIVEHGYGNYFYDKQSEIVKAPEALPATMDGSNLRRILSSGESLAELLDEVHNAEENNRPKTSCRGKLRRVLSRVANTKAGKFLKGVKSSKSKNQSARSDGRRPSRNRTAPTEPHFWIGDARRMSRNNVYFLSGQLDAGFQADHTLENGTVPPEIAVNGTLDYLGRGRFYPCQCCLSEDAVTRGMGPESRPPSGQSQQTYL